MTGEELFKFILNGSIIIAIFVVVAATVCVVLYYIGMWKLFRKALKQGWEAIIPYYNTYVLIEISGLNWWYFLITMSGEIVTWIGLAKISLITTLAGRLVIFFIFWNLGKKMHKSTVSTAILGTLFPGIMIPIMGLSKNYQYDSTVSVSPNGPIGNDTKTNSSNEPERFCLGCGQKLNQNVSFCENCGKKVE